MGRSKKRGGAKGGAEGGFPFPRSTHTGGRGSRRKARELVLQALYQCEISGDEISRAIEQLWEENAPGSADLPYFQRIAEGAWRERDKLDQLISKSAENWPLERISVVDRAILRQGIHELLSESDVPYRVVIDEAIELTKRYGGDGSDRFVNGILDRLARELRSDASRKKRAFKKSEKAKPVAAAKPVEATKPVEVPGEEKAAGKGLQAEEVPEAT
ncbi:MAG: transcription antitermination factor NusB [Magnetococcales bacterium]|nr:transcription antitermination factor NusB [Magnetococcales bacterium]